MKILSTHWIIQRPTLPKQVTRHSFNAIPGAAAALIALASPSQGATNLIQNGSFEAAGTSGVTSFTNWQKINTPSGAGVDTPASVILYGSSAAYPNSAYGESVNADNAISASPDTVGSYAAYFVGDVSVNETIKQYTFLNPGNYRIGFDYYLTSNGLANPYNSNISATIIGIPVAFTTITSSSTGQVWINATGVGHITVAGYYSTSLVFNSNGNPAKDVVIDRMYAISTTDAYTVVIPPTPEYIPVPGESSMLGGMGALLWLRRRRR